MKSRMIAFAAAFGLSLFCSSMALAQYNGGSAGTSSSGSAGTSTGATGNLNNGTGATGGSTAGNGAYGSGRNQMGSAMGNGSTGGNGMSNGAIGSGSTGDPTSGGPAGTGSSGGGSNKVVVRKKQALLFVNKKVAKKLYLLGHGRRRDTAHGPGIKVFAPLFSKSGFLLPT